MKRYFLILFLFQVIVVFSQSNPQLINFWDNTYLVNPASVTPRYKSELLISNRSQWVGVKGAPKTLMFTGSYCNTDFTSQIGAKIISDKIGYSDITHASLIYSYYINFSFSRLSFGLSGNYTNYNYDPSKITSFETGDPYLNFAYQIKNRINSDLGVEFTNENSRIGFSATNLFDLFAKKNLSYFNQNVNYLYYVYRSQFDALFNLGCGFALINNTLDTQFEFNLNSYIRISDDSSPVQLGFTMRTWNQYAFNAGLYLGENMKILYSYELNRSLFGRQTNGTHEIALRYRINRSKQWGHRNYFENQKVFY